MPGLCEAGLLESSELLPPGSKSALVEGLNVGTLERGSRTKPP